MTKFKKGIFSFILMSIGLLVGLLGGELLVRWFAPQVRISPCFTYDFNQAYVGRENCAFRDNRVGLFDYPIQTNELGLRMDKITLQKKNVLCVGDSYTFGWGVPLPQSFFGLIDQSLKLQSVDYQMINGAVPGYSTGHICSQMERLAEKIPIKKVIYFMCSNDVFDNIRQESYYQNYAYSMDDAGEVLLKKIKVYSSFRQFLFKYTPYESIAINSHLFHFLKNITQLKPVIIEKKVDKKSPVDSLLITKVSLAYLKNLTEKSQQLNTELMVVWIPAPEELLLANNQIWQKNYDYALFKKEAADYLYSQNKVFFDPLKNMNSVLKNEKSELSDYFIPDEHFNQKGYQLFYESISDEVFNFILN